MKPFTLVRTVLLGSAVATFGCAHEPNPNVVRAESEVDAAAADAFVAENAPIPLHDAQRALTDAQRADRKGEERAEVDHLAYLASRRVDVARAAAEKRAAVLHAEELARVRDAVVVETTLPPRPASVSLDEVHFAPERTSLDDAARADLMRVADVLRDAPERDIVIEGHADATEPHPVELAEERARQVRDWLIDEGVRSDRISARGYGATAPVATNATAEGRSLNRRVEVFESSPRIGAR